MLIKYDWHASMKQNLKLNDYSSNGTSGLPRRELAMESSPKDRAPVSTPKARREIMVTQYSPLAMKKAQIRT